MNISKAIEWSKSNPKKLFKIDGFGAILSAIFSGIIIVRLESIFGIPKQTLYFLAALPCLFAIYDLYCYFKIYKNIGRYLKAIATINLTYCFLSISLAIYHKNKITTLGWVYILTEIVLVVLLASIELKVSKKLELD